MTQHDKVMFFSHYSKARPSRRAHMAKNLKVTPQQIDAWAYRHAELIRKGLAQDVGLI
jgi:phage antirepressor YoqD-like protein